MMPRPYNARIELEGALERGDLRHALILAAEVAEDARKPLDLDIALRFLPLVAAQRPERFDAFALRWLARWLQESEASIDRAAEVAGLLALLPAEPGALAEIRELR